MSSLAKVMKVPAMEMTVTEATMLLKEAKPPGMSNPKMMTRKTS